MIVLYLKIDNLNKYQKLIRVQHEKYKIFYVLLGRRRY